MNKKAKKEKKAVLKYQVRINWSEKDTAFVAEVPELPGCATHGASYEEAAKNVEDAIETWMDGAKESGYPIPPPMATADFSGKFMTRVRPELHREIAMKAKEDGKSLNKFVEDALYVYVSHESVQQANEDLLAAIRRSVPARSKVVEVRSKLPAGIHHKRKDEDDCHA